MEFERSYKCDLLPCFELVDLLECIICTLDLSSEVIFFCLVDSVQFNYPIMKY